MGCNTSSEAKAEAKSTKDDKEHAQENHTNSDAGTLRLVEQSREPIGTRDEDKQKATEEKSEEQAATKIQAAFRGHKTRKTMSMKAATKQQQQQPQQQQQHQQSEPEPSKAELEAEFRADDKELCSAATKIQASFRGHQARKQTQAEKDQEQQDKEDIEKIDLSDPDLNKAATKIQASFRGHKVRKDVPN